MHSVGLSLSSHYSYYLLLNDFQIHKYSGPCPPKGVHRYFFKVYALDDLLALPGNTTKYELEKAMSEHIIGFGELIGLYKRK